MLYDKNKLIYNRRILREETLFRRQPHANGSFETDIFEARITSYTDYESLYCVVFANLLIINDLNTLQRTEAFEALKKYTATRRDALGEDYAKLTSGRYWQRDAPTYIVCERAAFQNSYIASLRTVLVYNLNDLENNATCSGSSLETFYEPLDFAIADSSIVQKINARERLAAMRQTEGVNVSEYIKARRPSFRSMLLIACDVLQNYMRDEMGSSTLLALGNVNSLRMQDVECEDCFNIRTYFDSSTFGRNSRLDFRMSFKPIPVSDVEVLLQCSDVSACIVASREPEELAYLSHDEENIAINVHGVEFNGSADVSSDDEEACGIPSHVYKMHFVDGFYACDDRLAALLEQIIDERQYNSMTPTDTVKAMHDVQDMILEELLKL